MDPAAGFINVDVNQIDGCFEKVVTPILTNKNDEWLYIYIVHVFTI